MRTPATDLPSSLPARQCRAVRGGGEVTTFTVQLKVVTPILGGGVVTRKLDEVDVIRVPTIRGHLRFWWRALYGHQHETPQALYAAEKELWGGATDDRDGQGSARSSVDLRVRVTAEGEVDDSERLQVPNQTAFYAMWPFREETSHGEVTERAAPQRLPGTTFDLTASCQKAAQDQVRNSVRAWILFGGLGSRTRRGLGSLTVTADQAVWLPDAANPGQLRGALEACFGSDVFTGAGGLTDQPLLAGAALHAHAANNEAQGAWLTALGWLQRFRQGVGPPDNPRHTPTAPPMNQPSISDWPEPDKARRLKPGGCVDHAPRHNADPAWPRAGFGLPMQTKWQTRRRGGGANYDEPRDFELDWVDAEGRAHDRLGSPLILKALALANGRYAPVALWLSRGYPDGMVRLVWKTQGGKTPEPRSLAAFDVLVAPGDRAEYAPIGTARAGAALPGRRLRTAFMDWLNGVCHTTEVAP